MYHLLAWNEDVATATLTDIDVVQDGIITTVNSHFMPPEDVDIYWAIGYGTDLQRVRITTPRLRQTSPIFVRPLQPTLIGANDANVAWYSDTPIRLTREEEITVEALHDAGVNQRVTVLAAIGVRRTPVPPGDSYTIRLTSTTAATTRVWSQLTYTLDSSLPQGRYAVCGSEMVSANGIAHRWTFDNQFFRPGNPSLGDVSHRLPYPLYSTDMGVYGYFNTYSLPRLEVLCNAADASHDGYLKLVKVG